MDSSILSYKHDVAMNAVHAFIFCFTEVRDSGRVNMIMDNKEVWDSIRFIFCSMRLPAALPHFTLHTRFPAS